MAFNFKNALEEILENRSDYELMAAERDVEEEAERILKSIINIIYDRDIKHIEKLTFYIKKVSETVYNEKDFLKVDYYKSKTDPIGENLISTTPRISAFGFNKDLIKEIAEVLKSEGFKVTKRKRPTPEIVILI